MRRIPRACAAPWSAALAVCIVGAAAAGEPEALLPTKTPLATGVALDEASAAEEVHLNLIDQKLALSLAVDTHGHIKMAQFALESIDSDAVRQLVTARLASQRDFAAELNLLTKGRTVKTLNKALRQIAQERAPDFVPEKKFRLLSIRNATALLARIRLEIQQDYAAMQQAELVAQSAEAFDRRYLRCDLVNQMQSLAALKVYESQASEDFARVLHRHWVRAAAQYDAARELLRQLAAPALADVAPVRVEIVGAATEP